MKEIVIKIPDEVLSFVYQNGFIEEEDRNTVHRAILECIELPKGHYELIDKYDLMDAYLGSRNIFEALQKTDVIVEADKEEA